MCDHATPCRLNEDCIVHIEIVLVNYALYIYAMHCTCYIRNVVPCGMHRAKGDVQQGRGTIWIYRWHDD